MNSSLVVKSLIGIGIVGGIAGGSAYALMPSNTKNLISEKLIENKYTILTSDKENNSKWSEIIESYKKITTAPENTLKFEGITGNENYAIAKLQQKCNELLKPSKEDKLDQNNYKKAEKWCVQPVSISEILKERGIKALNMNNSDKETNKTDWETKIGKHRDAQVKNKKIESLDVGASGTISETHITNIKTKCKSIGDQKNHQEKYHESVESFEFWCSE